MSYSLYIPIAQCTAGENHRWRDDRCQKCGLIKPAKYLTSNAEKPPRPERVNGELRGDPLASGYDAAKTGFLANPYPCGSESFALYAEGWQAFYEDKRKGRVR